MLHDADDVHVFSGDWTMLHARSRDGGRTWPVREAVIGTFASNQYGVALVGPGTLLAAAHDQYIGPVYWRSADHGTTWSATAPLFTVVSPPAMGSIKVLADGASAVVMWLGSSELRCRRTLDGGVTWQPETTLATWSGSSNSLFGFRTGSVIDVFWNSGNGTMLQRSTNGGSTWSNAVNVTPLWLSHATSNGTAMLMRMSTNHTLLHSANGGLHWTIKTIPGMPYPGEMAVEGTLMAVVGTTNPGVFGANTYAISVSNTGGQTWPASPLLMPSPVTWGTQVIVKNGVVYVRFYASDTLGVVTSRDGGNTWQLIGGPVSGGFWPGPRRIVHLATTPAPAPTYGHLHAYVGLGSTTLGIGTPGAGGMVPRLEGNGLPFQGAVTTLQLSDAVGGSLGALGISFAAPMPVPLGSAVLWPTVAPIVLPFATGGTAGAAGSGNHSLAIAIPVDAALVGASFTSQALVLDTANIDGFAVSNGLETWLR